MVSVGLTEGTNPKQPHWDREVAFHQVLLELSDELLEIAPTITGII